MKDIIIEFIKHALPWIIDGLLLAVFFALNKKNERNKINGMCLGMCFGTAIGVALNNNVGIGSTLGLVIGYFVGGRIKKEDQDKKE